jgi:predicted deacylase
VNAPTVRRVAAGDGGFDVYRFDSGVPGRRVAVLGGVHGDETEGILAAGRLAAGGLAVVAGTVDIVPICHEAAFSVDERTSPLDGGNLARVFPGDPAAAPTAMLAHHLFTEVLDGVDFLIDLHTSGRTYDMPFLAGYHGPSPGGATLSARAAAAFGASFVWRHPDFAPGRTLSVVREAIYVESPGSAATDPATVDAYVDGVLRVLALLGAVADSPALSGVESTYVTGGGDLDRDMVAVSADGFFLADVSAGARVAAGQRLGRVIDHFGTTVEEHTAAAAGWVMALKRRSHVKSGDLVVNVAAADDDHAQP